MIAPAESNDIVIRQAPASCAAPATPDEFDSFDMPRLPDFVEGHARIDDARLYFRDFGGTGAPVVLVHPNTGSALMWGHQVPALSEAGYRVIAYSRRGHHGSTVCDGKAPAPAVDLLDVLAWFRIEKCFLVATAAGCSTAIDFAISHSDRLRGMVLSSGAYGNLEEPEYLRIREAVRTKGLADMPPEFREVGPSYRGANPAGVKLWLELEHQALVAGKPDLDSVNPLTWATMARVKVPTLFVAGGADLAAPPTMMRHVANHVQGSELLTVPDSGHSVYWERPGVFNQAVVEFFRRRCLP